MKRMGSVFLALCLVLMGMNAYAERIGVVDLQKIMQTSPQMKAIQAKLEKEFKPRRDQLVSTEENLKHDMEKLKRDTAVLSQMQRKELEKKILTAQQKLERDGQQYQQELSTAHNEAMEEFYGKIRAAIAKVAESDKYDLVFQKDAAPFSVEKLDITSKVMQAIS